MRRRTHPHARQGKGKRYIKVQGSAKYVIRAKTKEEALALAREMLEHDITTGRKSFKNTKLPARWKVIAGLEAERSKGGATPRSLDLKWKNSPRQKWLTGKRG